MVMSNRIVPFALVLVLSWPPTERLTVLPPAFVCVARSPKVRSDLTGKKTWERSRASLTVKHWISSQLTSTFVTKPVTVDPSADTSNTSRFPCDVVPL